MDWKVLIIPLLTLAFYIVVNIVRNLGEAKEPEPEEQPEPAQPARRRSAEEMDRFLQEANSRREARKTEREPRRKRREAEQTHLPILEDLPRARPVRRSALAEARLVAEAVPAEELPRAKPVPPPLRKPEKAEAPPAPTVKRSVAPVVVRIRQMLADRESVKAAFALREIFDQPVSLRRRG